MSVDVVYNMMMRLILLCLYFYLPFKSLASDKKIMISCIENQLVHSITTEIMKEAYRKIGVELIAKCRLSKQALLDANEGITQGDMARIAGIDSLYPNLMRVNVPIFQLTSILLSKKIKAITDLKDLKQYRIGLIKDVIYYENLLKDYTKVYANTSEELIQLLLKDRADLIIFEKTETLLALNLHIQTKPIHYVYHQGILHEPGWQSHLYHYLHKSQKKFIPKLTKVLLEMVASGEINKITQNVINKKVGKIE
jgi:polar amino acid transport system substrate-binding protein